MAEPTSTSENGSPIEEGHGRLPWWVWAAIAGWLFYAFVIAPFNWFSPAAG